MFILKKEKKVNEIMYQKFKILYYINEYILLKKIL